MLFHQRLDDSQLLLRKTLILRQRDGRLKPELRLPVRTLHMNVHPEFFAREEVKPIRSVTENGWAHDSDSTTSRGPWEWCK